MIRTKETKYHVVNGLAGLGLSVFKLMSGGYTLPVRGRVEPRQSGG